MAFTVEITGITQVYFGGQGVLNAVVTDTDTGQAITTGLQYAWNASQGSFVGATNGASVTYHADFTGNTDQTVTIACEVTLPGNPNPTVSAPSLTAMDELGITGQLVNMLVTTEVSANDLFDQTDATSIATGSDTELAANLNISRIRWRDFSNQLVLNRTGTGGFSTFWDTAARAAYSVYLIINDGTTVEILGTWITKAGGGFVNFNVPSTETATIDALDSVASGQSLLLGIADTGSIGLPDETASADATVNVQYNAPPNVTITAPQKVNPGVTVPISVTAVDPEGRAVTVQWEATDGTIDNPTALNPNFTAPNTSGPVTLTCTARDADGVEGSNTHVIVVNSPPTVTITAPSQLEVGRTGNISIAVSDLNNDTVTVFLETSAGSIDNPTAPNAVITAPDTPQTVTITVTATDADGLQTVETAQITIVANQPPTLSITVPNALEIGQVGNLRAVTGDPTNDTVGVLWDASHGVIGNRTALNTTITAPATPQTITITCTATDDRGAMTTATATITVRQPNRPPTITLNVPATAAPGQTVNIVATVTDPDGDATTGEWRSPKGSIAQPESASTTFTAPLETGIVPLTYEAMNDMGATSTKTAYITVGDLKANIYTPAVRIEIEGVDVTDRRIPRDGLVVGKSLDYPELLNFRSSGVQFNLDNADGAFDYSNPDNLFLDNSLPAHGRGAQVLVSLGRSQSELAPVFAGEISAVVTSLRDTRARIKARDLSVVLRQKTIENFGLEITRRITDYAGANTDYDELNPVFYFPVWALPISRGSVSLTVKEGGSDVTINVVDVVGSTGVLSNRNAEVDYSRGLIRFEAAPDEGEDTIIDATWKQDYIYKRPDFLIRSLLDNAGINTLIGITDDTDARFAIERALVRHDTDRLFSTHGRPYFEREGIVRWMQIDDSDTDAIKRYFAHENRLIEYDEKLDEYTEMGSVPEDETAEGVPPGGYGNQLDSQTVTLDDSIVGIVFLNNQIYGIRSSSSYNIDVYDLNGTLSHSYSFSRTGAGFPSLIRPSFSLRDIAVVDDQIFVLISYVYSIASYAGAPRRNGYGVLTLDLPLDTASTNTGTWQGLSTGATRGWSHLYLAATSDRWYIAQQRVSDIDVNVFDRSGVAQTSESFEIDASAIYAVETKENSIYVTLYDRDEGSVEVKLFDTTGTELTDFTFAIVDSRYFGINGNILYTRSDDDNTMLIAYDIEPQPQLSQVRHISI